METNTPANLQATAAAGNELTWTVVPEGSETRIGIDRDENGYFDRDEIDGCKDPADAGVIPQVRSALVAVLLDPASAPAVVVCAADMDADGAANAIDIAAFAACLLHGTCP